MIRYRYQALDSNQQRVDGELRAENLQVAIARLEAEGLNLLSISLAVETPALANADRSRREAARGPSDGIDFERDVLRSHMPKVLEQGRLIAPALRAFAEEMPAGRRRRQLESVIEALLRGDSDRATTALLALPEYWIPLLSAVASSRDPALVLNEFLRESQQADELRRQRWRAWAYPLLIGGMALVVMTAISFFVIPTFRDIFREFRLQLPYLTEVVMDVADWIVTGRALAVVAAIVAIGVLLWLAKGWFPSLGNWLGDRWNPPFGRTTAIARLTRFSADLVEAGIDVPDALRIASLTSQRGSLRRGAWQVAGDIEWGDKQQPMDARHPLTATICHAVQADLTKATRVRMLREISQVYADRARIRLSWTRGMVEPIAIGVVGIVVGVIVLALFLPLVKLIEGLTR